MGARQDPDLDTYGADVFGATSVGALVALENGAANMLFEENIEGPVDVGGYFGFVGVGKVSRLGKVGDCFGAEGVGSVFACGLV